MQVRFRDLPFMVLLVLVCAPHAVSQTAEITAENLAQKLIEARGGSARLKAVKSQRVIGNISFGPGADGPFVVELKRPGKMHMEIQIQGQTIVRIYDGQGAGWMINPFAPAQGPTPMSGTELKNISDESDFDGPLLDYRAKGTKIEYLGKGEVEGQPAHKLKLTTKSGDVRTYFIDAASFLLLKWEGVRRSDDQDVPVESFFRDYREVGGIKFAFEIDSDSPGSAQSQKLSIEKIELDVPLDDARFTKPAAPPVSN